jgi:hypothetical protein
MALVEPQIVQEDPPAAPAIPASEVPGREELTCAAEAVLSLVKVAKALRMYLPNNPMLLKFVEEALHRMRAQLARYGEFRLEVEPFALRYRGVDVYQNRDAKESMAFRMHSDGIRVLHFSRGLAERELTAFLDIVGVERGAGSDDDIVTRLWESGLRHISYFLEDDLVDIDSLETEEAQLPSQQDALSELFRDLASSPLPPPRMVPGQLLVLGQGEADWLSRAVQTDARRDPLDDVITILCSILPGVPDLADFREFSAIMARLARDLFLAGETAQALRAVRFLGQLQRPGALAPERREVIAAGLAGILDDGVVQALQETLDGGDAVSFPELRELLLTLGLPSLGAICELLGRLEKLKMRKVVIEVLVELGKGDPRVYAQFLNDPRWFLVRNVVLVLSLLRNPASLPMIVGLISHREARVRKEVLSYLEHTENPKAKPYLLKFLRDGSGALRVRALQILGRDRQGFALKPLLALAAGDEFKTRELGEKKAVYEALGEIGGEQVLQLFRDMLIKKLWFRRSTMRESVSLAVAGVLRVRHESAQLLLDEARSQGNAEIRGLIDQALEAAAGEAGKTAA